MSKEVKYYCDVEGCDNKVPEDDKHLERDIQVIFTTEQTEGRATDNHLSKEQVDICEDCLGNLLAGHYLFGCGAMGHNTYWFKNHEGSP